MRVYRVYKKGFKRFHFLKVGYKFTVMNPVFGKTVFMKIKPIDLLNVVVLTGKDKGRVMGFIPAMGVKKKR